jgi:tetratricopeptide (TPR) repeat protein
MERMLADVRGALGGGSKAPAAESRARQLIYDAWETSDVEQRESLAHQALSLWPDCADAYVLLAEEADNLKAKQALYEKGVAAGERALGPATFAEDAGHFWGLLETRPYMRAREGLAACLWALGRREEAVAHYQDMLRLNPGDNQGVRFALAGHLVELGQDEALARLLSAYDEDATANWAYTRALLAFRQGGPGDKANALLDEARKTNPHIPDFLLGRKRMPRHLPEMFSFGDESEAIAYIVEGRAAWKRSAGALDWLAERCGAAREPAVRVTHVSGVDIRDVLIHGGERLSESRKKQVLALGAAAVPALVDVLEDEELEMTDGPGEGWAPIHAARLLGELREEAAAPAMVRVLCELDLETILYNELIHALIQVGPAVAGPVLAALESGEALDEEGLLEVLARCGAKSEVIFTRLCADFLEDPDLGAYLLASYGDARALPLLHEVLNAYTLEGEEGPLAGQLVIEIEDAIRALGGELSPDQQRKLDTVLGWRDAIFARSAPARREARPERNAPCWCGSGKKYKKCHLAEDEGRGK